MATQSEEVIQPLQYAVDVEDATEEEILILKAWKQYRVALNRVPKQEGYPHNVVWPVMPSAE